ncbi:hypothetical protein BJ170DRAFT_593163 [Xylariales sp. AK1849]|nr:hypothetical protein BJ170DRAFT_593163 [Xylariales sp. AK1849]
MPGDEGRVLVHCPHPDQALPSTIQLLKQTLEFFQIFIIGAARASLQVLLLYVKTAVSIVGLWGPFIAHPVSYPPSSTRRISASFHTDGPRSCQPSVATSSLTASKIPASHTYSELPMAYASDRHFRKVTPTNIPLPKPSTATTYTTASIPPHYPEYEGNIPRSDFTTGLQHKNKNSINIAAAKLRAKAKPRPIATLPKSTTLNVFSNLSASFSRTSLARLGRTSSISSTADSEAGKSSARSSMAFPLVDTSNPQQIDGAPNSAYWTGRFMSLQDRFRNEMLHPDNLTTLVNAQAERSVVSDQAATNVPGSASNPNLLRAKAKKHRYSISNSTIASRDKSKDSRNSIGAALLEDEENRARRVLLHLEALCTTSEARRSLHNWQQSYARRVGKEELLPRGGTLEDKGWMGRLLGRSSQDAGKRGSMASVA